MAYYLGIDGGGSKTTCAVGDENTLLATAIAGPSNIVRVGEAEARRSLHRAIGQACTAAGISPQQVTRTCIGAAGAALTEIAALIRRALVEILPGRIEVTGDMQIALEAAFPGGPGIVVIAGTGSIAYGRDAQDNIARAGGWGFAVSDEGSAHWIGRNAVAAILRASDLLQGDRGQGSRPRERQERGSRGHPQPDPPLYRALQQTWSVNSLDDLVRAANASPAPDFAALLPAVLTCAEAGDQLSRQVLAQGGAELARLAAVIIPRLFPETSRLHEPHSSDPSSASPSLNAPVPLAMAGGVFRHSDLVRQSFYNELKELHPRVEVHPQVVEPVEGALRLARSI